jgi:alkaline phosphatase D
MYWRLTAGAIFLVPAFMVTAAPVTHGVAVGEVRATSAVIWSRTDREAEMHVELEGGRRARIEAVRVKAEDDYTGRVLAEPLQPGTAYRYKVWFTEDEHGKAGRDSAVEGSFRTPPAPDASQTVTFAWGGDVAGQNVCRDAAEGFPIFKTLNRMDLDFFIGLGDMIYADGTCEATGRYGNAQVPGDFPQAATMADYWAHWKYNRAENNFRALLGWMPYYAIWDDHEVVNDFGPLHDTRANPPYTPGVHLLPMGLKAFLDYNPIAPGEATPKRLYRNVRWGKHLEMFILDTRQYRDANLAQDSSRYPKTMLGREQLVWLKESLRNSDATWKLIVSSVPMSIPTGFPAELGRDGWANYDQTTGFENELADILRHMKDQGQRNVVFITTDVHFAEVFRYTPFADNTTFKVHEIVTGPLNAGLFPNRRYDTTLGTESLFFYGPSGVVSSFAEAKPWMNFGLARIDKDGKLTLSINDVAGAPVYTFALDPQ